MLRGPPVAAGQWYKPVSDRGSAVAPSPSGHQRRTGLRSVRPRSPSPAAPRPDPGRADVHRRSVSHPRSRPVAPAQENGSRVNFPSACLTLDGGNPGRCHVPLHSSLPHFIPAGSPKLPHNASGFPYQRPEVGKVKDLLTTVDESCSIVAGSPEIGMMSEGRSEYTVPGIEGKPGVATRAVTRTGPETATWSVRSIPRLGGFQKLSVQIELPLPFCTCRFGTGLPSIATPVTSDPACTMMKLAPAGPLACSRRLRTPLAVLVLSSRTLGPGRIAVGAGLCRRGSGSPRCSATELFSGFAPRNCALQASGSSSGLSQIACPVSRLRAYKTVSGRGCWASKPARKPPASNTLRASNAAATGRIQRRTCPARSMWGINKPSISTIPAANIGATYGSRSSRVIVMPYTPEAARNAAGIPVIRRTTKLNQAGRPDSFVANTIPSPSRLNTSGQVNK